MNMQNKKLYRDIKNKQIMGVCAGLAQYLGLNVALLRIVWVFFTLFGFFPISLLVYFALGFILPKAEPEATPHRPSVLYTPEQLEQDLAQLQDSFDSIQQRVRNIERFVTSDEFAFQRKLWDLQDN